MHPIINSSYFLGKAELSWGQKRGSRCVRIIFSAAELEWGQGLPLSCSRLFTQLRERRHHLPCGLLWASDGGVSSLAWSSSWRWDQLTHTTYVSKEPSCPHSRRADALVAKSGVARAPGQIWGRK